MTNTGHSRRGRRDSSGGRAFSILEILIAVIIIGILAVLMVPTLQDRVRQARIRAAQRDMYELREALTRAAIDTGYYFPQHVLDDVVAEPGPFVDTFLSELTNPSVQAGQTDDIFIDPQTGDFLVAGQATALYNFIVNSASLPLQQIESVKRWGFNGSYLTWNNDKDSDDMQDDPWGNPYLFFTKAGLVWDYNDKDGYNFTDPPSGGPGRVQHLVIPRWDYTTYQQAPMPAGADCLIFDRPALLSMGPNGIPGGDAGTPEFNQFGKGDDILISFD